MFASVMLANFAKTSDGMLDVLGGGWTFIGPGPTSFFVAGLIYCQWHETNAKHQFRIDLVDADGEPFVNPELGRPAMVEATFEVGRPAGTKPGSNVMMPFAVPFGAFQFDPGTQYEVKFSLDGEDRDEWRLPFAVREAPDHQQPA